MWKVRKWGGGSEFNELLRLNVRGGECENDLRT